MAAIAGELLPLWTHVNGRRMFARVSEPGLKTTRGRVVLVHGLGMSSRYMVPLARALSTRYQVGVPDLPGFGRSERPSHLLTVAELAQSLALWMKVSGFENAVLAGNSLGCQIVIEYAAQNKDAVQAAVLLGPTMDPSTRGVLGNLGNLILDAFREPPSLALLGILGYISSGPVRTLGTFREAERHQMLRRVSEVHAKTLVLRGERDPLVSRRWAEDVTRTLLNGALIEIPGAAHALNYNSPERVSSLIFSFLDPAAGVTRPDGGPSQSCAAYSPG